MVVFQIKFRLGISGSFNVLGINMNAELSDIWEINLTKKLNEIRSLLARRAATVNNNG